MEDIVPISDLQTKAKEIIETVKRTHNPAIVTQRGRAAVLIVNYDDYEAMVNTLEEMSYPDWKERLEEAESDSKNGKGISLSRLKTKLARRRAGRK